MNKKIAFAVFLLALVTEQAVFAVDDSAAHYVGGTVSVIPDNTKGKMLLGDERNLIFDYKKDKLSIPYNRINGLEYGEKAGRRVSLDIAVKIALLSKKEKHYLTVNYRDANDKQQAAVFALDKNNDVTLSTLEARAGQKVEYQSNKEATKVSRKKGESARRVNATYARAEWFFSVQELEAAMEALDSVLELEPDLVTALELRGRAKHNAKRPVAEVLLDLDRALKLSKSAQSFMFRAVARYQAGLLAEALEDCNQAIRYAEAKGFDPDLIELQRSRGSVVINLGGVAELGYELQKQEAIKLRDRILADMKK